MNMEQEPMRIPGDNDKDRALFAEYVKTGSPKMEEELEKRGYRPGIVEEYLSRTGPEERFSAGQLYEKALLEKNSKKQSEKTEN